MKEEETYEFYREQTLLLADENKELKKKINKAIEYKNQLLFDLNRQYITFEKWEEILEPFENILKGSDKK